MKFSDLIGHKDLAENLRGMVDGNRLPHALLFTEQPGCGALAVVLALTQYLFCKRRREPQAAVQEPAEASLLGAGWAEQGLFPEAGTVPETDAAGTESTGTKAVGDSCDGCTSCMKIRDLSHSDFHLVFPINTTQAVEKGRRVPIDMYHEIFRRLVKKYPYFREEDLYKEMGLENKMGLIGVNEANWIINKLSYSAYEGGSKVVLIMFPERMNAEAANRLLKSIEEPTPDTYFLMVTNAPAMIIKTIRSRCRTVEVPPVEKEEIASALMKSRGIPAKEADGWAAIAQGSYGRALELINESDEDKENFSDIVSLLTLAMEKDLAGMLDLGSAIAAKGRESQKSFCTGALKVLREAYMIRLGVDTCYCSPERKDDIKRLSEGLGDGFFRKGYDIFNGAIECIERNVNVKFIFTDMCNMLYINTL